MRRLLLFVLLVAFATSYPVRAQFSYKVAGVVVDSLTGQPLSSAEVRLTPSTALNDEQIFLTSTDGRFLFSNLPPGKYRLMAGRRGYAVQGLHQHEAFMTAIVTGPDQDTEHIRFPLSPSSAITGAVSDQWNDPVREAEVLLFQQSWQAGSHSLHLLTKITTDDQGHYRFPHLLPGTYAIGVYAHPWWTNFSNQVEEFVRVIQTVNDKVVSAVPMTSPAPRPALDLVYPVVYFPSGSTLSDAAKISLRPGVTETADLTLRPVPSIHLQVRVPADSAMEDSSDDGSDGGQSDAPQRVRTGVDVMLNLGPNESNIIQAASNEIDPGLLELSGIPPGDISVTADTSQGGSESGRTQSLHVTANTEVDFTSHGSHVDVSGTVIMTKNSAEMSNAPTGPPVPVPHDKASTVLEFRSRKTGESFRTSISDTGEFSFAGSPLTPGAYDVSFPQDQSIQVSSIEATGATVSRHMIDIPSGQPVKLTVQVAESNCSLSGQVLKNGKPLAGAMILLVPQDADMDPSLFHRDQSDSDGSFSLAPLFPGRYTLLALEKGWDLEWSNPAVLFNYLPNGIPIDLQPGASPTFKIKVQ